jgi:hypothetical protein
VLVHRDASLVGLWFVPIACDESGIHARRDARLTPYCAPWLARAHPQRQRRVVTELLRSIQQHVDSIDLPMAPGFAEVTGCSELGVDAVWRHTRIMPREADWRRRYSPKARNQIRVGCRAAASIVVTAGPGAFDFDRGVVEDPMVRARFAKALGAHARLRCLSAVDHDGFSLGQAMVVADTTTAYLFHSWFARTQVRGVPSALVDAAIAMSFEQLDVDEFDFEGSILPKVDEFMSGFGADVRPYPQLRWSATGMVGSATLA